MVIQQEERCACQQQGASHGIRYSTGPAGGGQLGASFIEAAVVVLGFIENHIHLFCRGQINAQTDGFQQLRLIAVVGGKELTFTAANAEKMSTPQV